MVTTRDDIRNIAIIAHVDHGKTTLVDELLKQSGVFRANQEVQERVMDSNDIERERGITILSKNTAVFYKDTKINIIDTPGHADFGGEVERVLKMVNGVVLVVDAFEGTMPQTKFVLMKALALNLPVIVCINKIDRPEARPAEVIDEVLELFMDLDASDEQLDCPFIYASARDGYAMYNLDDEKKDMTPLFETIVNYIPAPTGDPDANTQVLISTIDYNEYVGRIGIGKVDNGSLKVNQEAVVVNHHDPDKLEKVRISKLYEFDGLNKVEVKEAKIGSAIMDADVFISLTHFKGHEMAGFGGTIKNIGMGCGSRAGKMEQHCEGKPSVATEACIGCGACSRICAHGAPVITDHKAKIDHDKCVGCGRCLAVCPKDAISADYADSVAMLNYKMAEYSLAVCQNRPCFHVSLICDVSPNCDCHPENDIPILPNIGMLASFDPVALDQACADLCNQASPVESSVLGKNIAHAHEHHEECDHDHFHMTHPDTEWKTCIEHAVKIGLGTNEYDLETI